jgi:diadenosine tetraphosphate (Ap4A) HIT family hydrolase
MFELNPQLAKDTHEIGQFALCEVLLMNDDRYPWVILVPRRQGIEEIFQLSADDQQQLLKESSFVSAAMSALFSAHKMNVAALGNMVEQLHVHHVARFNTDASWPNPIWGRGDSIPYSDLAVKAMLSQLKQALGEYLI